MANSDLNLLQRLAKIRKVVQVMPKNKKAYNYNYVTEDAILEKITGLMDKYEISLIPSISPGTLNVSPFSYQKTKTDKKGNTWQETINEIVVSADMVYKWVCNDIPSENLDVTWVLSGQQSDASQGLGSALSYCNRYFLLKFFNVATPDDDPDAWRSRQKEAVNDESKILLNETVDFMHNQVKAFLGKNPGKTDDVKKFFSSVIDGGNYLKISDVSLATEIYDKFVNNFMKEGI